jgi:hypothetical protein
VLGTVIPLVRGASAGGGTVASGPQLAEPVAVEPGEEVRDSVGRHPDRSRADDGETIVAALGMPARGSDLPCQVSVSCSRVGHRLFST